MFILRTKDSNLVYTEGHEIDDPKAEGKKKKLTWDDIPKDVKITSFQLVYPFPVRFRKPDGSLAEPFSPKLTIRGFDRYYFFNEATVPVMVQGDKVISEGVAELEAKTIAGIDDQTKVICELRMDKFGNCTLNKKSLKDLEKSIKEGIFRGEIIRDGI